MNYRNNSRVDNPSRILKAHLPCLHCGSSDALAIYDDGHSYCFSCLKYEKVVDKSPEQMYNNSKDREIASHYLTCVSKKEYKVSVSKQIISLRGISKDTMKFYGVYAEVDDVTGEPVTLHYPFGEDATNVRNLKVKSFHSEGNMREASCFGKDKFSRGMSQAITITEGPDDAMACFEMLGSKYPCISVKSASTARRDCERDFDYINSFDKIYLCFDNDKQGQEALKSVATLFDVNKVFHVKMDRFKDANDYLINNSSKEFVSVWWASKKFLPKGVVSGWDSIKAILEKEGNTSVASYPFEELQNMTYGIRLGEVVLLTAQEKVGKTEIMRAIEYHLCKTTDSNIGIIHLEEEEKRCVEGLIGYHLGVPAHLPDSGLSSVDKLEAFRSLERKEGRVHFYTHFGSDDPDTILGVIRYLVSVCGCKFVFLDHITMLVTGFENDDERKKLDYISTRLAMLTRELQFTLFLVSHVNDNGQTRGSRNISKVADLIVHLDRNIEAEDTDLRNRTKLVVKGNRFASRSGPAGILQFDPKTFRLTELKAQDSNNVEESTSFLDEEIEVVGVLSPSSDTENTRTHTADSPF